MVGHQWIQLHSTKYACTLGEDIEVRPDNKAGNFRKFPVQECPRLEYRESEELFL